MKYLLRLKWDFLLIVLLVLAGILFSFNDSPWIIRAQNPVLMGSRPPDRAVGDFLLLTPDTPPDRANQFSELDCSYAWYNALWQRYGSFASAKVSDLSPELLAGRLAVIVPESVASNMTIEGIKALEEATENGVSTLVEMPTEIWSDFLSLEGKAQIRKATYAKLEAVEIPLIGSRRLFDLANSDFVNHFSIDGGFGFFSRQKGKGRVFASGFEIGCNLISLQQGLPKKGMQFEKEPLFTAGRTSITEDSIGIPLADILETAVFQSIERFRPTPRLWLFPHGYVGAISIVHPRFELGYQRGQNIETGELMRAKLSDSNEPSDENHSYCIWSTQNPNVFKTRYFHTKYLPIFTEIDLNTQLEGCKVTIAQNMSWSRSWMGDIAKVSNSEILVDLSLGPQLGGKPGYLFGTGFPYYPVTREGLLLPTLLQPLLFTNANHLLDLERFVESSVLNHQMIGISFPTDEMKKRPDGTSLLILSRLEKIAEEKKHWLVSPLDWVGFLSERRRSIVSSQWFEEQRRLAVSVKISEGSNLMSLALPSTYAGEKIESILLDTERQNLAKFDHMDGYLMMELKPGRHKIELRYPLEEAVLEGLLQPLPEKAED